MQKMLCVLLDLTFLFIHSKSQLSRSPSKGVVALLVQGTIFRRVAEAPKWPTLLYCCSET